MSNVNVWDKLHDASNPLAVEFMNDFNEYNQSLGNSLTTLKEQPQSIQGRDKEIAALYAVLERPKTPVALLLGHAGVGKTALVEEFGKQLNSGQYATALHYKYMLIALRVGNLASIGTNRLQSALATLLDKLAWFEQRAQRALNDPSIRIVLFIDEVHMIVTIFGPGTKIGGDVIKDVLARSPIRVIAATTRREYDSTIAVDKPLAERFKQIEMQELPAAVVERIVYNWWEKVAPDCIPPERSVVQRMIQANAMYRSDSAEPRKSLDIVEDLVSYARRTRLQPGFEQLDEIFRTRYSINLSFHANADDVYREVAKRVKGQPFALYTLKKALRAMIFQLDATSNKPMLTCLLTGPTGVGKTETVKAISAKLYPGENAIQNINMPDYKTPEHETLFRKRIGEFVRHTPNAIILLDEFEKAHESVRDSMLTILDEGLITFETRNRENMVEVNTVSLRNTIVFATTNAGASVFATDAKFSMRALKNNDELDDTAKAEIEQLQKALYNHLQSHGFKAEMLGRFNRIVPYRGLAASTLLRIAESELANVQRKLKTLRGITLTFNKPRQWPKDAYDCIANDVAVYVAFIRAKADDPNSGGARAIKREINSTVYDMIIDAIIDHPECTRFHVSVSKQSRIYNYSAANSEGGIIVTPR